MKRPAPRRRGIEIVASPKVPIDRERSCVSSFTRSTPTLMANTVPFCSVRETLPPPPETIPDTAGSAPRSRDSRPSPPSPPVHRNTSRSRSSASAVRKSASFCVWYSRLFRAPISSASRSVIGCPSVGLCGPTSPTSGAVGAEELRYSASGHCGIGSTSSAPSDIGSEVGSCCSSISRRRSVSDGRSIVNGSLRPSVSSRTLSMIEYAASSARSRYAAGVHPTSTRTSTHRRDRRREKHI